MKALTVFLALAASNFVYQYMGAEPNIAVALERTWFQGNALFVYYLMQKFVWRD